MPRPIVQPRNPVEEYRQALITFVSGKINEGHKGEYRKVATEISTRFNTITGKPFINVVLRTSIDELLEPMAQRETIERAVREFVKSQTKTPPAPVSMRHEHYYPDGRFGPL
jgi:hypothetical protein